MMSISENPARKVDDLPLDKNLAFAAYDNIVSGGGENPAIGLSRPTGNKRYIILRKIDIEVSAVGDITITREIGLPVSGGLVRRSDVGWPRRAVGGGAPKGEFIQTADAQIVVWTNKDPTGKPTHFLKKALAANTRLTVERTWKLVSPDSAIVVHATIGGGATVHGSFEWEEEPGGTDTPL